MQLEVLNISTLLIELILLSAPLSLLLLLDLLQLVSRKDHKARGLQPADDRYHSSLLFIMPKLLITCDITMHYFVINKLSIKAHLSKYMAEHALKPIALSFTLILSLPLVRSWPGVQFSSPAIRQHAWGLLPLFSYQ